MLASFRPDLKITFYFTLVIIASCFSDIHSQRSKLSLRVELLSEYLSRDSFSGFSESKHALALIDSLYIEALRISESDKSEALYTLMFTTIQYRMVPLRIPFTPFSLNYPLLSPSSHLFDKKNKNIPSFFLFDSKFTNSDDRDKPPPAIGIMAPFPYFCGGFQVSQKPLP